MTILKRQQYKSYKIWNKNKKILIRIINLDLVVNQDNWVINNTILIIILLKYYQYNNNKIICHKFKIYLKLK